MHTLIDNSQTITHWIYYHTNAKLYDFIKWVFNFYVLLGNPYILNWFCKEVLRLIIHTRTSAVSLETLFNIREVIKKRLSLRPVTTIHINHSSLYCTFLLMQMGVKFKTTNNLDFFLRVSCESKNRHQKWFERYSRQYHSKRTPQISCFKGILKGHFYYLKLFFLFF